MELRGNLGSGYEMHLTSSSYPFFSHVRSICRRARDKKELCAVALNHQSTNLWVFQTNLLTLKNCAKNAREEIILCVQEKNISNDT